jgi:cobalamin biosynthesis protein CobC
MSRDHGGNLDWAKAHWGGEGWIDLSTGINRVPYPMGDLPPEVWTALPGQGAQARLLAAARRAYRSAAPIVALAGAQAAIQLVPRLSRPGLARVVSPTYNEHAAMLRAEGWRVEEVSDLGHLAGADLAVVVNPNNPDGRAWRPEALLDLVPQVGRLVVDESFADPVPDLSLAPVAGQAGLIVLRSFGKFYGLAGLRLGFALGPEDEIEALARMAGPWPVPGVALEIGARALGDVGWAQATTARLAGEAAQMDEIARGFGWQALGGTQDRLARARIWSRIFPWSPRWLRLGLPGSVQEWARLSAA